MQGNGRGLLMCWWMCMAMGRRVKLRRKILSKMAWTCTAWCSCRGLAKMEGGWTKIGGCYDVLSALLERCDDAEWNWSIIIWLLLHITVHVYMYVSVYSMYDIAVNIDKPGQKEDTTRQECNKTRNKPYCTFTSTNSTCCTITNTNSC